MHNLCGDNLRVNKSKLFAKLNSRSLCNSLVGREHHGEHDNSVAAPLNFRSEPFAGSVLGDLFESLVYIVFVVQLVDIDDLASVFEGASADESRRVSRVAAVLLNVVVTIVSGYRSHVVLVSFEDEACAESAVDLTSNTVAVSLRIFSGVYEEAFLNGVEISANF